MTEKMDRSKQGSIRGKLILILLLVCGIPILFMGIINYKNTIKDAIQNAEELNLKQAFIIEEDILAVTDRNLRSAEAVASNPFTREFIKEPDMGMDEMIQYLQAVDASLGDGNSTVVTGSAGFELARSKGDCVDISRRDYYKKAMNGESCVSEVIVSSSSKTRIIVTAAPVKDTESGEIIGTVQRNVNLDALGESLSEKISGSATAFIVDEKGIMTAHSEKNIPVDSPADMSGSSFFLLSKESDKGSFVDTQDGSKAILSYIKEPSTGWVIVVSEDYDTVMSSAYGQAAKTVCVSVIIFIIVAVISFFISGYFTRPLNAICEKLELLASGQFSNVDG